MSFYLKWFCNPIALESMSKKVIITSLLAIILVGLVLFLVQQRKIGTQENQTQKQEEVGTKNEATEPYPQHIEVIIGTDEVWYNIPEYGVRMRLNKEFADNLIYSFVHEKNTNLNEEWDAVYFSTKSLIAIDNGCSPEEGSPLGVLTKTKGNASELAKTDVFYSSRLKDIIQIGEYYYMWTGPQAVCWNPNLESEARRVFPGNYSGGGKKYVSDGLKTIQLIPSK